MEKQKRWQFYLILAVIVLTIYNILPTIFYYANPLKSPIDAERATTISKSIVDRVDNLEEQAKEWLWSFSKLLHIKPQSIQLKPNDTRLIEVKFAKNEDAALFNRFLPQAGAMIPFVPSQLNLYAPSVDGDATKVLVAREVGTDLNRQEMDRYFRFTPKQDADRKITTFYQKLVNDRATALALSFAGVNKNAQALAALQQSPNDQSYDDLVIALAKEIVETERTLGSNATILKRYYKSFSQIDVQNKESLIQNFLGHIETLKTRLETQAAALEKQKKEAASKNQIVDSTTQQQLVLLDNQRQALSNAANIIKQNMADFKAGSQPLTYAAIQKELENNTETINSIERLQPLSIEGHNPFVKALIIDWGNDKIYLKFYDDVQAVRLSEGHTEVQNYLKEKLNQYIFNDIAHASQLANEKIQPDADTFSIALNNLTNAQSFLALDLGYLAANQVQQIQDQLQNVWIPKHPDLVHTVYPVHTYETFKMLKPDEQKLGFVIYAPTLSSDVPPKGLRTSSIYVIARGMETLLQKSKQNPEATESQQLITEINQLVQLLQKNGFIGYPGSSYGLAPEYSKDYIFELNDYYMNLLRATREDFAVKGSNRFAVLDFTDVEQRILTENRIDDRIQEDLLKWDEEYRSAQVDINVANRYLIPAPTQNPYWENFKLSFVKYFRGDDRKVLKLGLDLSGGKTVRIGLRDHNGRPVTNPDDLKQAMNELYTRINKMGVSERAIHIENHNIILDFPGVQGLSASELVKASAMYFHIVNEKFGRQNPSLRDTVNKFLQDVWNEAVVTNRKDIDSINEIAWQHLGGESIGDIQTLPRSENAQLLWDNGLRLANPKDKMISSAFNDTLSSIAMLRGSEFTEWEGQAHPLLIVFHNFALEGSSLTNIQVGYDPTEGNILTFNVKSSYEGTQEKGSGNPRDDLYAWTSQFAEEKIVGTPKEAYSQGRGWRMAVILNGTVISQPALRAALRDGATISGRFSQREINQLAADLKAGSLSFTPRILSEENVSPELGKEERNKGIIASVVALIAVVVAMVGYYRFAGLVASCAVLFNILIMWGVLQNLDAALTLPGIAGIVLTIGMAVDANVLVFERIREEFKISGRIASAIQAGYRKAFSAIIDSNITTIIAALVLIQFDSGPIKGFAVTLIIGIVSSMFTALFMTRYFFAGWVQNPNHKSLTMSQWIHGTHIDFLGKAKIAIVTSLAIMVIGCFFFVAQFKTMFGMDFTGGYSLNVELVEKPEIRSYRLAASEALLAHGATTNDFQIRELSKPNQLRIQLGTSMEEKDHPFYQMPETNPEGKYAYGYESNPRIVWLVKALADGGLQIPPSQLTGLDRSWTVISGQFSDAMRNNAIAGLATALIGILLYITIRFEFKYAIAAVIALAHDVVITVGILAIFNKLGFPVQIDLQVIGAIMTIIGYSLNDTIIVFDRIREDLRILRKMKFSEIVNHALNVTLGRTLMTSGTTLLVLLALVLLGGKSIFAFSLVMTIGVLVGTFSSLFIATPALVYFHNREVRQQEKALNPNNV